MYWCISYYDGDLTWLNDFSNGNYHVYLKDVQVPDGVDIDKTTTIENVGYNIYAYMKFIVDNYDNLPELTVFCKNNTFPRHVSKKIFADLTNRKVFTSIEDVSRYKLNYPVSIISCDNGFMELNTSWYTKHHSTKYFYDFYDFFVKRIFFDDENEKNQKKVKIMSRVKVLHLAGTEKVDFPFSLKGCDSLAENC